MPPLKRRRPTDEPSMGIKKQKVTPRLATKSYVDRKINRISETKYFDTANITQNSLDTGTLYRLTAVTQGTQDTQRVGDQLRLKAMNLNYGFQLPSVSPDAHNTMRVIVFQWHPNDSIAAPVIGNIIQTVGNTVSLFSENTNDAKDMYTILYDRLHTISLQGESAIAFKAKIPLKYAKKTMQFDAGTVDASNHIYMIQISDSSAAGHPIYSGYSRLWYKDA